MLTHTGTRLFNDILCGFGFAVHLEVRTSVATGRFVRIFASIHSMISFMLCSRVWRNVDGDDNGMRENIYFG